jgi:hypothetical protein
LGGSWYEASTSKKFEKLYLNQELGMMVHACYIRLHSRLRLGGLQFQASMSKKVCKTPTSMEKTKTKKLGVVVGACHSSDSRKYKNRKISV